MGAQDKLAKSFKNLGLILTSKAVKRPNNGRSTSNLAFDNMKKMESSTFSAATFTAFLKSHKEKSYKYFSGGGIEKWRITTSVELLCK